MLQKTLCLTLSLGLLGGPTLFAQSGKPDPEVAKGVRLVEEGEYDAAILTLDEATRRLAADPARIRELSQAYLYLGIAYVAKGQEMAAKAKFREAISRSRDLSLSPDRFSPKVIDLFEAAKQEAAQAAASPGPRTAAKKDGGGSKKGLVLAGVGLAAAGGTAFALKGGGDGACDTVFVERIGQLRQPNDATAEVTAGPASESGAWKAELSWREVGSASAASFRETLPPDVAMFVNDPSGNTVAQGQLLSQGMRKAEWNGGPGVAYRVRIFLEPGEGPVSFTLSVSGPCK